MKVDFVSKKPWSEETLKFRIALFFTGLVMAVLGLIIAIIGVVLIAYAEYVVGCVAIIGGVLIPVAYIGVNIGILIRLRKKFDNKTIAEYIFKDDELEVIRISDNYKFKAVISYAGLKKVINRVRYFVVVTKEDSIVVKKSGLVTSDGANRNKVIGELIVYLMSKISVNGVMKEVTCTDKTDEEQPLDNMHNAEEVTVCAEGEVAEDETSSDTESADSPLHDVEETVDNGDNREIPTQDEENI